MQSPFPSLDESRGTGVPARAETLERDAQATPRSTGVPARAETLERDAQATPRSTGVPTRADLQPFCPHPTPSSPACRRGGANSPLPQRGRGAGGEGNPPFPEYKPEPKPGDAHEIETLRAEAEAIRLQAIQDAERVREQAQREGYQRGYEQGYADGERDARQHAETELEHTVKSLRTQVEQVIQSLQEQYESYIQNAEAQMLTLVLEVARKVVREELKLQPEHALAIVRDALRRVQGFVHIRIRVNPLDLELVRQHRAALLHIVDGVEGIEIVEDRRVDTGGCIIETEQGVYDARIRTQLSELERAIRDAA